LQKNSRTIKHELPQKNTLSPLSNKTL
jgi:hypothetical protein